MKLDSKPSCLLLFLVIFTAACQTKVERVVKTGIYYWKTNFKPTDFEKETFKDLQLERIYLHFFDVDYRGGKPVPVIPVRILDRPDNGLEIVPVVFITQAVLEKLRKHDVSALAKNINTLVSSICQNNQIQPTEIQLDADWTTTTKDVYFTLLKALRNQVFFKGKLLSCTIRLHQVKYTRSAGYPPVDKGLLMCYNMSDVRQSFDYNSIFDEEVAISYLKNISSYPLPLDIAFPIFSWVVWFRGNDYKGILRGFPTTTIAESSIYKQKDKYTYELQQDTLISGYALESGDRIRVEKPVISEVQSVAKFLAKNRKDTAINIVLFHSDSLQIANYTTHELEKIYNAFR